MEIIDLFAGPGGWDEGLRSLGRGALGIEWDDAACATARAAGHPRLQADIATLDPREFGPVEGLIASPPCQSFSAAGKGKGRADKQHVIACAHELAAGFDSRWQYGGLLEDERSLLTVEPLRWALALRPRWLAFEQVPAVLELWSTFAPLLAAHGYAVDVGLLTAEQYGVPQTRKRAYLVASLDGPVSLPEPTHTKYRKGKPKQEGDLLPWVSMAEALGWADGIVGFPRRNDRDDGGEYRARYFRPTDAPAFNLTEKARSWTLHTNRDQRPDGSRQVITCDRPAPTLTAKSGGQWTLRQSARSNATERRTDEPAFTLTAGHDAGERVWLPEQRKITVEEASALMGFRPGYPWQGSRTKQFEQVGNAVCPPVGARVLATAMAPTVGALDVAA